MDALDAAPGPTDDLLFFLLKGGTDKRSRDSIGISMASFVSGKFKHLRTSGSLDPEKAAAIEKVREKGYCPISPLLSLEKIDEIKADLEKKPLTFYDDRITDPTRQIALLKDRPAGLRLGRWSQEDISLCPVIMATTHDPKVLDMAEAYLGAPPTLSQLNTWWSFPSSAPLGGTQVFHHDTEDFRAFKIFVYLTDVTAESGPHQYVEESHHINGINALVGRKKLDMNGYVQFMSWFEKRKKSDAEIVTFFGQDNLRTITGLKGFTFLEDPSGLHRGLAPVSAERQIFEMCFTVMPASVRSENPKVRRDKSVFVDERIARATRLYYFD